MITAFLHHVADFCQARLSWYRHEYHPASAPFQESKGETVFVINGFWGSAGSMVPLATHLADAGYGVRLPLWQRRGQGVREGMRLFREALTHHAGDFSVVAFSMGGLIALSALADPALASRVRRIVLVGSPLDGCVLGSFPALFRDFRELALHSPEARAITHAARPLAPQVRILTAVMDEIVFPRSSFLFPNVTEVQAPVYGHVSLVMDPRGHRAITRLLI